MFSEIFMFYTFNKHIYLHVFGITQVLVCERLVLNYDRMLQFDICNSSTDLFRNSTHINHLIERFAVNKMFDMKGTLLVLYLPRQNII